MRLWIAAFLLCLFAYQTLPLAALGKAIAKTQIADVDDDDIDADDDGQPANGATKAKKQSPQLEEDYLHHYEGISGLYSMQAAQALLLHHADHLPDLYAGEVATPPPNCC
jgi:hypothetical protein